MELLFGGKGLDFSRGREGALEQRREGPCFTKQTNLCGF